MIKKIEVIGLPGQGKSTLVGSYFEKPKKGFMLEGFFRFPAYLFFWVRVLLSGKSKNISLKKYFKIIFKRGLVSTISHRRVVDEGSLQNFLSFFEYFDSIEKIKKSFQFINLPKAVIVVRVRDKEESIKRSSVRLTKRRGIEENLAIVVSREMSQVLDNLIKALEEKGVEVVFFDSFDQDTNIKFKKYLNEKSI